MTQYERIKVFFMGAFFTLGLVYILGDNTVTAQTKTEQENLVGTFQISAAGGDNNAYFTVIDTRTGEIHQQFTR